jgi:hypothetical protein
MLSEGHRRGKSTISEGGLLRNCRFIEQQQSAPTEKTSALSPRRPPSGSFCFSRLPSRCSSRPQSQSARPAPRVCKPEAAAVQRRAAPDPDLARSRWAALTRVRFELGFRTFGGVSGVLGVAVNCWGSGPGLGL